MSIPDALSAIQSNGLVRAITKSNHLVIASFQIIHVFGFLLLLTSLVLMSLRLLGLTLLQQSVSQVTREPVRLFWCGLSLAAVSGVLMFVTGPRHYFYNRAFDFKMSLLLAAVALQLTLFRKVAANETAHPILVRASVALSLLFWFGIAMAGRAIGFV